MRLIDADMAKAMYSGCRGFCEKIDKVPTCVEERPKQKPLTLKEFCERLYSPVWFESHGTYRGKKGFWIIPQRFLHYPKCETVCYASENSSANSELSLNAYGEVWRAWATKPTEEEREAAKWE